MATAVLEAPGTERCIAEPRVTEPYVVEPVVAEPRCTVVD